MSVLVINDYRLMCYVFCREVERYTVIDRYRVLEMREMNDEMMNDEMMSIEHEKKW